jgi:hypothetical protein
MLEVQRWLFHEASAQRSLSEIPAFSPNSNDTFEGFELLE